MKEKCKRGLVVTEWAKEGLGMTHLAMHFAKVRYEDEDKEQDDPKDH